MCANNKGEEGECQSDQVLASYIEGDGWGEFCNFMLHNFVLFQPFTLKRHSCVAYVV